MATYLAKQSVTPALSLTVDYGQKAAKRELAAAYMLAKELDIPHRTVWIPYLREAASGALVDSRPEVPRPTAADLDDFKGAAARSAKAVWVPNRNLALITMAATWAEANDIKHVIVGFNREEGATFPDNSAAFVDAVNSALSYSTANHVEVISPTLGMDKHEMIEVARRNDFPIELCWSCYLGGDEPCRTCESCRRFERAVELAGAAEWLDQRRKKRNFRP